MAGEINITPADLVRAEVFLENLLSKNIPTGNFKEGSHLHDVVIRAFSYVKALIDAEATEIRARQSLLTVEVLTDESADAATNDLVSNWFITRKDGTFSTGTVTIHLGINIGDVVVIPVDTRFTFVEGIDFLLNSTVEFAVGKNTSAMVKQYDSDGALTGYKFYAPLVADLEGSIGNILPGKFASWDTFDANVTMVEAVSAFSTAVDTESNEELIARSKTAVTARDLVSVRAIDTTLQDELVDVREVVVVGAGDIEMERDKVVELALGVDVHVLGHVNVYTLLPTVDSLVYPPNAAVTATLAANATTLTLGTDAAYQFPFLRITKITATIGANPPEELTRRSSFAIDPDDVATEYKVLLGDAAAYVTEVNDNLAADQYRITYSNNLLTGTPEQAITLNFLGNPADREIHIEYAGVKGLSNVDTLLTDANRRVLACNVKSYALIPIVASININYYADPDAPGDLSVEQAKSSLVAFINSFDTTKTLRVSDIVKTFLDEFSSYVDGVAFPVTITHRLQAPDGNEILYSTTNRIEVEDTSLLVEASAYSDTTRKEQQISNRTTRVVTFNDLITLTSVS